MGDRLDRLRLDNLLLLGIGGVLASGAARSLGDAAIEAAGAVPDAMRCVSSLGRSGWDIVCSGTSALGSAVGSAVGTAVGTVGAMGSRTATALYDAGSAAGAAVGSVGTRTAATLHSVGAAAGSAIGDTSVAAYKAGMNRVKGINVPELTHKKAHLVAEQEKASVALAALRKEMRDLKGTAIAYGKLVADGTIPAPEHYVIMHDDDDSTADVIQTPVSVTSVPGSVKLLVLDLIHGRHDYEPVLVGNTFLSREKTCPGKHIISAVKSKLALRDTPFVLALATSGSRVLPEESYRITNGEVFIAANEASANQFYASVRSVMASVRDVEEELHTLTAEAAKVDAAISEATGGRRRRRRCHEKYGDYQTSAPAPSLAPAPAPTGGRRRTARVTKSVHSRLR